MLQTSHSHARTASTIAFKNGCFSFSSYALIISGLALMVIGGLALYAPNPQSLSDFHNWYFFCNVIGRNQGMLFLFSGLPLFIIGVLGKVMGK